MTARIESVLAPNPGVYTLEGTNTWIVGETPSVVIDPGPEDDGHLQQVADVAEDVSAILLTHGHEDHAPGAARLAELVGAPVFASDRSLGDRQLSDGQTFEVGGASIAALHTPGHSPDSFAFFIADDGALFTGDSVLGRGTSMIDAPEGVLADYISSLQRMRSLAPRAIYPGHGPVVADAVAKLDEYLSHRADREGQVIAALEAGDSSIDQIVARIYADYPEDVRPLAARSVLAHLIKLGSEDRVRRTGDNYSLT